MEQADRCADTERETFAFSQPGDRGLPFDVFGRWQPLMRISMAAEWLWQIELAELHLLRSTGRQHRQHKNIRGCKLSFFPPHFSPDVKLLL